MLKGIHAVFRGMPLFWGRGYLDRALAVMERAASDDVKLSKDTVKTEKVLRQYSWWFSAVVCERTDDMRRVENALIGPDIDLIKPIWFPITRVSVLISVIINLIAPAFSCIKSRRIRQHSNHRHHLTLGQSGLTAS